MPPHNGKRDGKNWKYAGEVQYSCDPGYQIKVDTYVLDKSYLQLKCGHDMKWSTIDCLECSNKQLVSSA